MLRPVIRDTAWFWTNFDTQDLLSNIHHESLIVQTIYNCWRSLWFNNHLKLALACSVNARCHCNWDRFVLCESVLQPRNRLTMDRKVWHKFYSALSLKLIMICEGKELYWSPLSNRELSNPAFGIVYMTQRSLWQKFQSCQPIQFLVMSGLSRCQKIFFLNLPAKMAC